MQVTPLLCVANCLLNYIRDFVLTTQIYSANDDLSRLIFLTEAESRTYYIHLHLLF